MNEKGALREEIDIQILDILKKMAEDLGKIAKIYQRLYADDLQETEADPDAPKSEQKSLG